MLVIWTHTPVLMWNPINNHPFWYWTRPHLHNRVFPQVILTVNPTKYQYPFQQFQILVPNSSINFQFLFQPSRVPPLAALIQHTSTDQTQGWMCQRQLQTSPQLLSPHHPLPNPLIRPHQYSQSTLQPTLEQIAPLTDCLTPLRPTLEVCTIPLTHWSAKLPTNLKYDVIYHHFNH